MVSNNTLEMSFVVISRGFIILFHMKAKLLTFIPVDLNGIIPSGRIALFPHIEYSAMKTHTQVFFHKKNCPIDVLFAKCCYERDLHDCSNPLFQTLHTPFFPHSCPPWTHLYAQTQDTPLRYPSCNTQPCQGMYASPYPRALARHHMIGGRTLIPSKTNLNFFAQHW
jgi:hypothetical protein